MKTKQTIPIQQQIIAVNGKVFYNDRRRRIDVKKPLRDWFPDDASVSYHMELGFSEEIILKRVKELIEQNVYPVLTYFAIDEEGGEEHN